MRARDQKQAQNELMKMSQPPWCKGGTFPAGLNKCLNKHLNKILKIIQMKIPQVKLVNFNIQKAQGLILKSKIRKNLRKIGFSENYEILTFWNEHIS